jgi:hypothetical protein
MRRRAWPTPITRSFSISMAEAAGLTRKEGPWQTYPRRMLTMRARSWALRDGFADVLRGLSIREEVEDHDNLAAPLPQLAFAKPTRQSTPMSHRGVPRPRFADYLSQQIGVRHCTEVRRSCFGALPKDSERGQSHAALVLKEVGSTELAQELSGIPEAVSGTVGVPINDNPGVTKESQVSQAVDQIGAPQELTTGEKVKTIGALSVGQPAEADYALVDAEGRFIETESLSSLRDAFDRLFADPHISADQVLGLWESNEAARYELARAFGESALVEADHRRENAERQREQRLWARPRQTRSRFAARPRHANAAPTDEASKPNPPPLDPTCSDDKLLQRYRSRLIALKRRRANAATFIAFREVNGEIEERLRQRLPAFAAEIDAIYAWAAVNAG